MEPGYFIGLRFLSPIKGERKSYHVASRDSWSVRFVAVLFGRRAAPAAWTVVDLGVGDASPHYAGFGQPYWSIAINNSGNVAYTLGSASGYSGGTSWPLAYFRAKGASPATATTVDLGGLDPYTDTAAYGINDNNIVVGDSYNGAENVNFEVAMAWKWNGSTGGTMVALNTISGGPGADNTNGNAAFAINNLNQVTGMRTPTRPIPATPPLLLKM